MTDSGERQEELEPLPKSHLSWTFRNRFLIYLAGMVVWGALSWILYSYRPQPALVWSLPTFVAAFLLGVNAALVYSRRDSHQTALSDASRLDEEVRMIKTVQTYGGSVMLAASVVAAFLGTRGGGGALVYLGASIVTSLIAVVPFWLSGKDWRSFNALRHIETTMLILASAWLVEAILIIAVATG